MPFVPTPLVAGTVAEWADFADNMTDLRAWLNAIPLADVQAESVEREHLVRPFMLGFPTDGTYSSFQAAFRAKFGITGEALTIAEWGSRRERLTITPGFVNGQSTRWLLPIGRTIHLPFDAELSVFAAFDMQVRSDPGAVQYPDGAGAGQIAGSFRVYVYDRVDDTVEERQIRTIYPMEPAVIGTQGPLLVDKVAQMSTFARVAGYYDIGLIYYAFDANVDQLDLTRITFHVEALEDA
jgi:hypothetical protein